MPRTFRYPRPRPRGLLGRRFEADEQLVAGLGAALALLMLAVLPGTAVKLVVFVAVLGLCAAAVMLPYKGRTYLRWWEVRRSYRRLLRRGDLLYRSRAPMAGQTLAGRPSPVDAPVGVPAQMQWFRARTAYGDVAFLLQPSEGLFTAVVEVEGQKNFGGLDWADQEGLVAAWETLLRQTADAAGRISRLQWLARIVPVDPNAHARDAQARREPKVAGWLHDSYEQLLQRVAISAEDRRLFLVVGIRYSQDLVAEALRYRSLFEGYGIVLGKEVEAFIRTLGTAQLRWVRSLDEGGLASFIHHSYAPDHWLDDVRGMNRSTCWPAEMDAREPDLMASRGWETSRPWLHCTAWIKQFPTVSVGLNFLAPLLLYVPDVICTISVTMDLVPSDRAMEDAISDATNELGQANTTPGKLTDPRERREQRAATSTMEEIATGSAGVRLTGWVTISASDADALEQSRGTIRAASTKSQLAIEWCDLEQYRAFANTLPLACGLLRS
ncbi:SCO6880 family protein [Streptomyces rhizosphaericus]|uniref:SCO6880 family protein n=1 Tax=Streptomyces rhizosphaericus TaxID=114699 RepID=UPI000A395E9C|nr:SCO6880 family protein [Streptomyces rhizosphaericus]